MKNERELSIMNKITEKTCRKPPLREDLVGLLRAATRNLLEALRYE